VAVLVASGAYTPNRGDDLRAFGAAGAAGLPPQKARLALMAGLASGGDAAAAIDFVHRYAVHRDFHDRSTH
jgi:L-asparaginase/Glu-tRNA(Gln) amidotransferase subunit D